MAIIHSYIFYAHTNSWHLLNVAVHHQYKQQFLIKQCCPQAIFLSPKTALYPPCESITLKYFVKYAQCRISLDERTTYSDCLPLSMFTLLLFTFRKSRSHSMSETLYYWSITKPICLSVCAVSLNGSFSVSKCTEASNLSSNSLNRCKSLISVFDEAPPTPQPMHPSTHPSIHTHTHTHTNTHTHTCSSLYMSSSTPHHHAPHSPPLSPPLHHHFP